MARKILSCFFAVLFVPIFIILLIVFGIKSSVFSANFYKTTLQKSDIYNQLLDRSGSLLSGMVGGESSRLGLGPINTDDLQKILKDSISPVWLKTQIENIPDKFFAFANGKNSTLDIIIPLTDIKKTLPENLSKVIKAKIETLPTCTSEQTKKLQSQKEGEPMSFDCKPQGMDVSQIESGLLESITGPKGLITNLPDQYDIGKIINQSPQTVPAIQRFFYFANIIFIILLIASVLLFVFIGLLNVKYLPGMLKWLSIPLLIASGAVLIFGFFGQVILMVLLGGYTTTLPAEMRTLVNSLIGVFSQNLSSHFKLIPGIILVLAIALLIVAIVLCKKHPYQPQEKIDNKNKIK